MKPVVVVAGLEPLGLAIVERLATAGAEVRAVASPAEAPGAVPELERLGARVITGSALYAFFTGSVVARRLDAIRGRVPVRGHDHIVVAGAGHVGVRVARILAGHGHRLVVVERNGESRHVSALRAEGHHVIVAGDDHVVDRRLRAQSRLDDPTYRRGDRVGVIDLAGVAVPIAVHSNRILNRGG